jgi:2-polyprenyl-6-methoxyphenol hydroxylase-like FAD-dependent oxidoreductase
LSSNPLEVLIAGGGIGGLAAALALARKGIRSQVFEKAPEFGEIGFGLQLGPNAHRMLTRLGIVREVEQTAVFPNALIAIDALTDRELTRISTGDVFRKHFGAPYMVVHRRDLHGALLAACRGHSEIVLHTSKGLVRFEDSGSRVTAHFSDGSQVTGSALIGADGLNSVAREAIMGDGPPRVSGHVTYRGVVQVDDVKDKSHFDDMTIWIGPGLHLVQYRLRGGTVMNNVATFNSPRFAAGNKADFGGPEELMQMYSHTTAHVQEMLSYIGKDKNWILCDREPRGDWTRGNVTLLGDAAHPTLQYLAQGAVMAMEDAVVLAEKLGEPGAAIGAALVSYQEERYLRTARVQITSRIFGEIMHARGGARDLRNHLMSKRDPEKYWEVDWLYRGI